MCFKHATSLGLVGCFGRSACSTSPNWWFIISIICTRKQHCYSCDAGESSCSESGLKFAFYSGLKTRNIVLVCRSSASKKRCGRRKWSDVRLITRGISNSHQRITHNVLIEACSFYSFGIVCCLCICPRSRLRLIVFCLFAFRVYAVEIWAFGMNFAQSCGHLNKKRFAGWKHCQQLSGCVNYAFPWGC